MKQKKFLYQFHHLTPFVAIGLSQGLEAISGKSINQIGIPGNLKRLEIQKKKSKKEKEGLGNGLGKAEVGRS